MEFLRANRLKEVGVELDDSDSCSTSISVASIAGDSFFRVELSSCKNRGREVERMREEATIPSSNERGSRSLGYFLSSCPKMPLCFSF